MSIVWLNGAFGVGKTTVARGLLREWRHAALFDPEPLARLIRNAVPPEQRPDDYQDLPLWRRATVELVAGIAASSEVVIVPMTLIDERYFDEIVGALRRGPHRLHHYALTARPATIRRRLLRRQLTSLIHPRSTRWALDRVDHVCTALADPRFHDHIDTDALTADEIVRRIAQDISGR